MGRLLCAKKHIISLSSMHNTILNWSNNKNCILVPFKIKATRPAFYIIICGLKQVKYPVYVVTSATYNII